MPNAYYAIKNIGIKSSSSVLYRLT